MDWRGGLTLGGRLAGALARIAADRAREWQRTALPRTPAQIARPEAINRILANHGNPSLPAVKRVSLPDLRFESSNCLNFVLEVEWEEGAPTSPALPSTLYVKMPCEELATWTMVASQILNFDETITKN